MAAALGLIAAPLAVLATTPGAQASPSTGLVISEVYGGGGNSGATYSSDFIELYNPTGTAISVTDMSVQYRSATGTSAALTNLTGSVPAHGHYLIQEAAGTTVTDKPLPTPDATGTLAMSGSNGVVILASDQVGVSAVGDFALTPPANVIDTVGYGTTPTTFETTNTAVVLTNATSVQRLAAGVDSDKNNPDFSEAAPTPANASATPAPLTATGTDDKLATTGQAIAPFTLAATGGTAPLAWTATGLPSGVAISTGGEVSGTPTAAGTYHVTATVTDASTPTPTQSTTTFTIRVSDLAAPLTIAQVQGPSDTTPYADRAVTTTGVVTAAFSTGGLDGFYLQTGGPDTTPNASDAVFVYAGNTLTSAQYPTVGATVRVNGTATEFELSGRSLTEIEIAGPGAVAIAATTQPAVVAKTLVPGTDCVQGACLSDVALDAARESTEGELFSPSGDYTATDVYDGSPFPSTSSGNFGEIGLAAESSRALIAPTELYDAQTQAAEVTARTAYNDAHRIILDDGSSLNYSSAANTGTPIPWFTADHYVRNGAAVTFPEPVVLTVGFDGWTMLPSTGQVVGDSTGSVNFAQNRPAAPSPVGADIVLATFNVLNYFPTTGAEFTSAPLNGTCTYYTDRAGNNITDRSCNPDGPRGAADAANLQRQQSKIVHAINGLGASIVSLEEIENSSYYGKNRDSGVQTLVAALNADAGANTWAFAPSPTGADLPAQGEEDVIRTAFIFKPAAVSLVGASKILVGSAAFSNAREPLAQGFKGVGQSDTQAFAVIVNHLKSKGSGDDDGTGQGNANPDRVAQANALKTFAADFTSQLGGSGATFLTGDFNAYTMEDPVQVLTDAGYHQLESTTTPGEESYNYSGLDGSLDHVFANPTADAMVSGVDIWNINADESVYEEYSRFNYNATNLYSTSPYRASDHNPEIIGIDLDAEADAQAEAKIVVRHVPGKVKAGKTRAKVFIRVTGDGVAARGSVRVAVAGQGVRMVKLDKSGKAQVRLDAFSHSGVKSVLVTYNGSATIAAGSTRHDIRVIG